jgi:hypothetical protein
MFEPIEGLPDGVVGLRAVGRVTGDDYKAVLVPEIDRAAAGGRKARLLLELGQGFEGFDPSAVAADAGVGIEHFRSFERVAVVTDADWVRRAIHLFGPMIPGDVRVYAVGDGAVARDWISGPQ